MGHLLVAVSVVGGPGAQAALAVLAALAKTSVASAVVWVALATVLAARTALVVAMAFELVADLLFVWWPSSSYCRPWPMSQAALAIVLVARCGGGLCIGVTGRRGGHAGILWRPWLLFWQLWLRGCGPACCALAVVLAAVVVVVVALTIVLWQPWPLYLQ